jgi:pimeloyl-ACP methyl ester carboxylesterase
VAAVAVAALLSTLPVAAAPATSESASATPAVAAAPSLKPCPAVLENAWCGSVRRPWDPTGAVPGTIGIGFAFVPASDTGEPAVGTIVAQEGGPGFPSTGSAGSYAELFEPLLDHRNLLMVDQRGTGRSQAVDCPQLQELDGAYAPAAGACARSLAPRAHLYGTDLAADDLAAVIRALSLGRVDLYGDSYGTFFAQTFAGRHPDLLRTLTLDAAYPTFGQDAWFDTQGPALRRSLAAACRNSPWCRQAGGDPTHRFEAMLARVRHAPLTGTAPGADGVRHRIVLDAPTLAYVAYNATYVPATYRELDAAVRAALQGDRTPLLRLAAEAYFPGGGVDAPADYSEGLDAAVVCRDYPQLFDLTATPTVRRRQLAVAVAQKERSDPRVYAPFTISEYLAAGWGTADWCTEWTTPPRDYTPAPPRPPGGRYAPIPTLVLSGELDTITTPAEGRLVTARFPRATQVLVTGGLHVTALGDNLGCVSGIVRSFVSRAKVGDSSCARRLPPLRTAPPFWPSVDDARPATPTRGGTRSTVRLQTASVAVATAGDVVSRWWQTYEPAGLGLRGGTWEVAEDDALTFTLDGYRIAAGVAVSGTVVWDAAAGTVVARLRTIGSASRSGTLTASWDTVHPGAKAEISGTIGRQPVRASLLAP